MNSRAEPTRFVLRREARGRRILGVGPENKKPPDGESGGPLVDPTQ